MLVVSSAMLARARPPAPSAHEARLLSERAHRGRTLQHVHEARRWGTVRCCPGAGCRRAAPR